MKKKVIIFLLVLALGFGFAWYFGFIPGTKKNLVKKILANNENNKSFAETKDTLMAKSKTDLQKMIEDDMKNLFPAV